MILVQSKAPIQLQCSMITEAYTVRGHISHRFWDTP